MIRISHGLRRLATRFIVSVGTSLAFTSAAFASGSSMPWETPLNQISRIRARTGRQNHVGDHHHRDRPDARVR